MQTYSSKDVAEKIGVSLRQLRWWDETGALVPKRTDGAGGGGNQIRQYDDFEFELVTALKRMRDAGVPLRVWRDHIEAIVRALKRSESVWVVTDGTGLWTARLADDAAILANGRYRVWVVRIK